MSDCVAAACKYIYKNILCGATRERESSGLGKAEVSSSSSPVQSERWFFFYKCIYKYLCGFWKVVRAGIVRACVVAQSLDRACI